MKRLVNLCILALLILVLSSAIMEVQKSSGPPSCYSGEPPNKYSCLECHNDGTLNDGSAKVLLDLGDADSNYIPGETYTITVSVSNPGMKRAGFQLIALRDDNIKLSPGKITLTDASRTQLMNKDIAHGGGCLEEEDEDKEWVQHNYAGCTANSSGLNQWSFKWKAPDTDVGSVTFYLAALEANSDLTEGGDHVYALKKTITAGSVGIPDISSLKDIEVYPMPARNELMIRHDGNRLEWVTLYTLTGQKVKEWDPVSAQYGNTVSLPIKDIKQGLYVLDIQTSGRLHTFKKVVIDP